MVEDIRGVECFMIWQKGRNVVAHVFFCGGMTKRAENVIPCSKMRSKEAGSCLEACPSPDWYRRRTRRRQVVTDHAGNGGKGRSERSKRSPLRQAAGNKIPYHVAKK